MLSPKGDSDSFNDEKERADHAICQIDIPAITGNLDLVGLPLCDA
jgi:hypothetical protein